jgi:hypothetical protein
MNNPAPYWLTLNRFPKSQHIPSLIVSSCFINNTPTRPIKRWNFRKADWDKYNQLISSGFKQIPSISSLDHELAYSSFCKLLVNSAKSSIPLGFRQTYTPTWDEECTSLYKDYISTNPCDANFHTKANNLTECLDKKRWEETVKKIYFTHSSRVAWKTVNRLTGKG